MADLRRAAATATIDFPIDNETTADAGTDGNIEDRGKTLTGTEESFGQAGYVGVVAQHGRHAEEIAHPLLQRKVVPAFDLMRLDDRMRVVVYRAAESDADTLDMRAVNFGLSEKLRDGLSDLSADTLWPSFHVNRF